MKLIDWEVDAAALVPLALLDLNHETIATHRSDLHRWNTRIPCELQNLIGQFRFH